jgi:ABC-2 type transport system permease protein
MTLFRLEIARMVRTHRWMILLGAYGLFGVIGPLMARYLNAILERFGGDLTVTAPDPRPVDGIAQFASNGGQLGLLAVVVVAATALSLDARPEVAAFLRTKVARAGTLLLPRFAVSAGGAVLALITGTGLAWALTASLIGAPPVGAMLFGTLLGALYLVFVVAVVAAMAGLTRSVAGTVLASLGVLFALPVIGLVPAVSSWLPSELLMAVAALIEGEAAGHFGPAAVVTLLTVAALVAFAVQRHEHREL